jgi:hypothetical protein
MKKKVRIFNRALTADPINETATVIDTKFKSPFEQVIEDKFNIKSSLPKQNIAAIDNNTQGVNDKFDYLFKQPIKDNLSNMEIMQPDIANLAKANPPIIEQSTISDNTWKPENFAGMLNLGKEITTNPNFQTPYEQIAQNKIENGTIQVPPTNPQNNIASNTLNTVTTQQQPNSELEKSNQKPEGVDNETWALYQEMSGISKQQTTLDALRGLEYLSNAIAAQNQPRSRGFEAPVLSYTPTPSSRDRDLSELRRQASSEEAKVINTLQESGMVDNITAAMADVMGRTQLGKYQIGTNELNRQGAEAQRRDAYANAQSEATTNIQNKNIEKVMGENAALGAEYTGNMENFFRTATDINRQRTERSMIKNLALGPNAREDLRGKFKADYGFAQRSKQKNTSIENNSY